MTTEEIEAAIVELLAWKRRAEVQLDELAQRGVTPLVAATPVVAQDPPVDLNRSHV
jgi:hypothetical protein